MDYIPINALFDLEGATGSQGGRAERQSLIEADVIIAVDEASKREFTVFGTPALEQTTPIGKWASMRVVRVGLDHQSGDLDKLAALVRVLKGLRPGIFVSKMVPVSD